MWNYGEIGLSTSIKIGGVKVIAKRGSKGIVTRMPGSREWLTIAVCVSANGDKMPSQYIFTSKEFCGNYIIKCEPNAIMSMQKSGWMNL